jgi:hypothetical protein
MLFNRSVIDPRLRGAVFVKVPVASTGSVNFNL